MIPQFPEFKKLELSDKEEIKKTTSQFLSYSHFNFANLWTWNIYGSVSVSNLYNNLVIILNDHLSEENNVSFIGKHRIDHTAKKLIVFSTEKYNKSSLKFIPEEIALSLDETIFSTKLDECAQNYIYDVSRLANMQNWYQNSCGKNIRKIIREKLNYIIKHSTLQNIEKKYYLDLFVKWSKNNDIEDYFEVDEFKAFNRIFEIYDDNFRITSLYIEDQLVAFSIYEILDNKYALSHFAKADTSKYKEAYDILDWEEAKLLQSAGIEYYNWEEDLGLKGLRFSKIKKKPSFYLKEYTVSFLKKMDFNSD